MMIRNYWYAILESKRLGPKPLGVRRLGLELVLWRDADGRAVVMPAACPHRGADLRQGRIVDGCIECPYHGFRYNGQGTCTLMPCEGGEARIPKNLAAECLRVREAHDLIWMWWGDPRDKMTGLPWFEELLGERRSATARTTYTWPVPFELVMENMLDLHHFPFVHRRWSFGGGPRLDPFSARLKGQTIYVQGKLRRDDDHAAAEASGPEIKMTVHFPGVMLAEAGPKLLVAFVCTPIDEENTWFAVRYDQSYITWPLIGRGLAWIFMQAERKLILPDDARLLATAPRQRDPMSDKLIRADKAIALWRKLREQALRNGRDQGTRHGGQAPSRRHGVAA